MTKKLINVASTILDYSLDSEWCGSANIAHLIRGYFIPLFVQRTSQGSHIFIPFIAQPTLKIIQSAKLQAYGCTDLFFEERMG